MFERFRANRAAKRYHTALAHWQRQRDAYAELLHMAQTFEGDDGATGLVLGEGERVFATVHGASLVEDRRGQGHWQGGSAGVSIPIGSIGGHAVRYRVGATRGHYVQGTPTPTAIDTGTLYLTDRRVVFEGARRTCECLFDKLVGFQHDDAAGTTVLSVSNRQKPTVVHYGPSLSSWFDFRLDLALAHHRGQVPQLVAQLEADLATIDTQRPAPPTTMALGATGTVPPAGTIPPAGTSAEPSAP